SAVSMALKPRSTKRSSSLNEVASSAVQPKTLPPSTSGAISRPERPSVRFSMVSYLSCEWGNGSVDRGALRAMALCPHRRVAGVGGAAHAADVHATQYGIRSWQGSPAEPDQHFPPPGRRTRARPPPWPRPPSPAYAYGCWLGVLAATEFEHA